MTDFLYQIAGYAMQSGRNPLSFDVVLVDDHTRSEEVVGWLAGQDVGFQVVGTYGTSDLRCARIIFDNTMQAAIFKTRFVSHG